MLNRGFIILILGVLLIVESFFLFVTAVVAKLYASSDFSAFFISGLIAFGVGLVAYFTSRNSKRVIYKRDGYFIVSMVWIVFSIFGALPFVISQHVPTFTDAFFETMSGFTTTGISVFSDVESLPHGLLLWRSLTQWIGGMGIIVLSLAILPFLNIGGMQLFAAEVPGISHIKLTPKLKGTAIRLWLIYIGLTILEIVLLWISGMPIFDAVCHSFTTMSTGGFSTKNSSIGFYGSSYIQYIIIFFMVLSGTNLSLIYYFVTLKFEKLRRNEEFFFYIAFILFFTFIMFVILLQLPNSVESTFRVALFSTASLLTTTGFVTFDYGLFPQFALNLVFIMMFIGGSTGSTVGGIKVIRVVVVLKNIYYELRRLVHPRAVIPIRIDKKSVSGAIVSNVLMFVTVYALIFAVGAIALTFFGMDFDTAVGASLTSISNVGPGLGDVMNPMSYCTVSIPAKWILSTLMLVGRLEVFTVIALLTPQFWRS
ncbi:MAG: potassium transporter TrkG [Salinivirgaceae bacterium]|nr:potassium transporter TrkG [Salinivirgaceae bacterium]MDD4747173.1 potassium transporter TrkG [Salinivirgaceae bacterium]MDY0280603.1 potassium transporter TrkG [Salinivirgaceae bacterium]